MVETKNLVLRQAVFDDWKSLYINLWRHKESAKYMLWRPLDSEQQSRERIIKVIEYQKKNPHQYIVCEKSSGQAIGFAGMTKRREGVYEDTGIAIGPAFVRRGYGKQILMGLMQVAFEQLEAKRFVSSCRNENLASRMLLRACGFTYSHSEERVDSRTEQLYQLEFYDFLQPSLAKNYHLC